MEMTNGDRKRAASRFQPTGQWIRSEKRLAIYLRDRFRCAYCQGDLHDARPSEITLDHLETRSNGGMNHESNLVTACLSCNSRRRDASWMDFASPKAVKAILRQRAKDLAPYLMMARNLMSRKEGGQ
jgi:5-methylcytosine-specific restriction endonuclease McrA